MGEFVAMTFQKLPNLDTLYVFYTFLVIVAGDKTDGHFEPDETTSFLNLGYFTFPNSFLI